MPRQIEQWTCPVCGRREDGTGTEGLWPPLKWQVEDAGQLVARCREHALAGDEPDLPDGSQFRTFPGPA